jgi:hypothetical protein
MPENFDKITKTQFKTKEEFEATLKEELNLSIDDCTLALSKSLSSRAEELVEDLPNMAPFGNYSKMTEDPKVIVEFLKEEAHKQKNWVIDFAYTRNKDDKLLEIIFNNKAIDDGDNVKGYLYVGLSGIIRHAFVQSSS